MTDIGKLLANLDERLKQVERASRLSSASVDDTALEVRDAAGSLRGLLGQQSDGTTAVNIVNGGPPPTPSTPTASPALGGIAIGWDGLFAAGAMMPLDWSRTEVHTSPTPAFTPATDTLQATMETAQGGIAYVPSDVPLYVALLARNTSGAASPATAEVGPYAPKPVAGEIGIGEITETLIADGAVTTPKVYANAITTAHLAAGAVDATALNATAITGKTITGGTIVGTDITGGTVTGGVVRTGTTGERIVLTPAPPLPIVQRPSVLLYSGATGELFPGIINSGTEVAGGFTRPLTVVSAPGIQNTVDRPSACLSLCAPHYGDVGGRFLLTTHSPSTGGRYALIEGGSAKDASTPGYLYFQVRDGAGGIGTFVVKEDLCQFVVDGGNVFYADPTYASVPNEMHVEGVLRAKSIVTGTVTITPSAPHAATSATVSGLTVAGTTFRGYATASTTVVGVRSPLGGGAAGVTGVATTSVTSTGLTVWVNRENTTATVVNWMVIGT